MTGPRPTFFLVAPALLWMLCGSAGAQDTGISSNGKQRALLLNMANNGREVVATVGQPIEITLQTIGPGSYDETPQISSPAIRFENVHLRWPVNPGGPTQVYTFRAAARGKGEIRIPHIDSGPVVRPTFVVTIEVVAAASEAQVSSELSRQSDGRRIQNIQPEEMWTRVAKCVLPAYPKLALTSQVTGTVDIGLCVSPTGEVASYRVLSGHPLLVNAAVSAIQQWKFEANLESGAAKCSRVRALVSFNADGTTTVALAHAILADDFGDPGLPSVRSGGSTTDASVAVQRPASAPECQPSAQP